MGDISTIVGGGTPKSTIPEFWNGNINWFTPSEISNTPYIRNSLRKITKSGLMHSSASILPVDSILMTSRAGIGKMAILASPGSTNQGFQSLVLNQNINSYFVYSLQNKISKLANLLSSGSTFTEISGKKVAQIKINIPMLLEEQTKIGEFFKQLDDRIAVNQRE